MALKYQIVSVFLTSLICLESFEIIKLNMLFHAISWKSLGKLVKTLKIISPQQLSAVCFQFQLTESNIITYIWMTLVLWSKVIVNRKRIYVS